MNNIPGGYECQLCRAPVARSGQAVSKRFAQQYPPFGVANDHDECDGAKRRLLVCLEQGFLTSLEMRWGTIGTDTTQPQDITKIRFAGAIFTGL